MLSAKLFAVLAIVFLACASLARLNPTPAVDIAVHNKYYALGPMLVLLFCAATSANFAVLYYAAARFFNARWNRTLSVLHVLLFVCFGLSFAIVFAVSTRVANDPGVGEALRWSVIPFFVGILSLAVCVVLFAVNLAIVIVQILRARFAGN